MTKYSSREEARMVKLEQMRQRVKNHQNDPEIKARKAASGLEGARRAREWMAQYKLERGCIDCGFKEHPSALDFDHLGSKSRHVSQIGTINAAHAEIQDGKCVVRCKICHQLKTWCNSLGLNYDPKIVWMILPTKKVRRYIAEYKLKRGCKICGYNEHFIALDFHHLGDKGLTINHIKSIWRFDLEMVLFPCEVLCSNHHQILHHGEP